MTSLVANAEATISGTENAWSVAIDGANEGQLCRVALTIEGDSTSGYHLVMSPDGFFKADNWYVSIDEAMEDACELFGVVADDWAPFDGPS